MLIYTITIFETGNFTLNPFKVGVGENTLTTDELDTSILSVLPKNEENPPLKDIVGPYRPKLRPIIAIIISLSLIGVFVLLYFMWKYFFQKKGQMPKVVNAERKIDPYKYAIHELQELKIETLKDSKSTYSKISFVLRFFTGMIFNFGALQMTTREIRKYLRRQNGEHIHLGRLINILKRSDMVKFAKENPQHAHVQDDIDESIEIIEEAHRTFIEKEVKDSNDV